MANYNLMSEPVNGLISGCYMNATGDYDSSRVDYICSKNKMSVYPSAEVSIVKTKGLNVTIYGQFYDKSGRFVSASSAISMGNSNPAIVTITVPDNCYWMNISANHIYMEDIDPSEYGFSVYIDYKYFTTKDEIENGGYIVNVQLSSDDFFQGLYAANSVIDKSGTFATKRIGLTTPLQCKAGSFVTYNMYSDQQLSVKVFPNIPSGEAQTALQESSWLIGNSNYILNYDGYLIMNLRKSGDAVIAPSDYASDIIIPKFESFDFITKIEDEITDLRDEIEDEITGIGSSSEFETDKTLSVENMPADAKVVGDKVAGIKEDLSETNNNVYITQQGVEGVTVNYDLLDNPTNGLISGFYNNATGIYDSSRMDYACSKYRMFALPSDEITFRKTKGSSITLFVQFYDKNGNFVSSSDSVSFPATNPSQKDVSVPNNCYWFNVSLNHSYMEDINPSDYAVSVYRNYNLHTTEYEIKNGGSIKYVTPAATDFFQGLYASNSIVETSGELASTKRIGLITPIKCKAGAIVKYNMYSDQQLSVKVFPNIPVGDAQIALQESSWLTGEACHPINYDGYLILNVRKSGDAVITPSDYTSVVSVPEFVDFDYISAIKQDIANTKQDIANTQAEISGTGSLSYYGEKIKLDSYTYSAEQIGSVAVENLVPQSSAIYGSELFTMYTGGDSTKTKFSVYNLLTNTVSGAFYMDSDTPYLHCNSACFGNKQNNSDEYPLLYINSYMDNNVGKGVCYVQKIIKDGDAYTTEQVQRIAIDFADQEIWTGKTMNPQTLAAGNWIVDTAGNRLIAYTTQGFDRTRFFVFELPDVSEANVTLTQSDILDYFDVAYIANIQDSCLHNGMIYLTSGIDWGEYDQILRVYAINLSGRCIVSEIPLEKSAPVMRTEPEGIDYYNGALLITTVTKRVMRLVF